MIYSIIFPLLVMKKYEPIVLERAAVPAIASVRSVESTPATQPTREAPFAIPELGIYSNIVDSPLNGTSLTVPDREVGHFGSFYMGHTPGVFSGLARARVGQKVIVNGTTYTMTSVGTYKKNSSTTFEGTNMGMYELVYLPKGQISLMTCAGGSDDYRIIILASANI